ncbi:MAG: hypothetical protein CMJ72_08365 [Planctomycetaceae bacterium]|nr:hypothetical protein [Planctomycetaceae bacterium]
MQSVGASKFYPRVLLAVAICAVSSCLLVSGCQQFLSGPEVNNQKKTPRTIYALGHLRPATGVIDIRATPGDRLKSLADGVEQNNLIPADGILGTLDSYDMGRKQLLALEQKKQLASQKYQHQKQLAAAQLAQSNATKAQMLAKQQEVLLKERKLVVLEAAMELEKLEYEKLERLRVEDPDLVTLHQLAKQKNKLDMANQDFEIANQSCETTRIAADLAVDAATESYKVAHLTHEQVSKSFSQQLETRLIDQEIEVAKEALKRSMLLAPKYSPHALEKLLAVEIQDSPEASGVVSTEDHISEPEVGQHANASSQYTVLKIAAADGEIVTQSPIMQLGDLRTMICIAEVYEADRKELFEGQKAIIRSPAFSGYFADGDLKNLNSNDRWGGIHGKIDKIGRMIAPPGLTSRNPLAPADRSVVEVRIEIDSEANEKAIQEIREEFRKQNKQIETTWSEDANSHAAENVGLQVTVEFCSKEATNNVAAETGSREITESSEYGPTT